MEFNIHESLKGVGNFISEQIKKNPMADRMLADCVLTMGPSTDSRYQVPLDALYNPAFVGDSAHIGLNKASEEIKAMAKANENSVGMRFVYNRDSKKYDAVWSKAFVGDAQDLVTAQTLTPWSVNWFRNVFKQPLAWSKARKFVTIEQGTDPWAEAMSMPLAQFSGFAALNNAGSVSNTKTQDVEVQTGMMSRVIINMDVTYKITVEELKRLETSGAPWAGQMISLKQEYATWVLEMLTDVLIYWGNSATETTGIFTVNGATAWSGIGSSLSVISAGASTSKGSDMYALFAKAMTDYLTTNLNKLNRISVGMSPLAYNIFTSQAYSSVYNPNSAMKIFNDNFMAGEGEGGSRPVIDIFPDPLLSASTVFNELATDYMVIAAPSIGTGPGDEQQPLVVFGAPLMDFVYPVVPGQFTTQYRELRRVAGIFAPYTPAIKVYTGFGV
jgi:hypothetical protein